MTVTHITHSLTRSLSHCQSVSQSVRAVAVVEVAVVVVAVVVVVVVVVVGVVGWVVQRARYWV